MTVCLSVWNIWAPNGRIFMKYLSIFRKSVEKIQFSLKSDKKSLLYMKTNICLLSYLAHFVLEWEMFQIGENKYMFYI
jgi:hypothetical protein